MAKYNIIDYVKWDEIFKDYNITLLLKADDYAPTVQALKNFIEKRTGIVPSDHY